MRNLRMTLECSPTADLKTCESFGLYKTPLPISTNNHLVLDLLSFTSTRKIVRDLVPLSRHLLLHLEQMAREKKDPTRESRREDVLHMRVKRRLTRY